MHGVADFIDQFITFIGVDTADVSAEFTVDPGVDLFLDFFMRKNERIGFFDHANFFA